MHQVNLSDQQFADAQRAAAAHGFESVDSFIAGMIDRANMDATTPLWMLESIDQGLAEIESGRLMDMQQVEESHQIARQAWLLKQS